MEITRKCRNVTGPQGESGRIVRQSGYGQQYQKIRKKESKNINGHSKDIENDTFLNYFWDKAESHGAVSRIKYLVNIGLNSVEKDLKRKRDSLKVVLLEEESILTREYVDRAQKRAEDDYKMKKAKVESIIGKGKSEKESYAKECYDKIFMETCDEYKNKIVTLNKISCAKVNQQSIKDKILAREKEKEEDAMWLNAMQKLKDSSICEENSTVDTQDKIVEKQRIGKLIMKQLEAQLEHEEKLFLSKMKQIFEKDEEILKLNLKAKKDMFDKLLKEQIEENKRLRDRCLTEQNILDKVMADLSNEEINIEKSKITDERMANRAELDIFQAATEQVKNLEKEAEEELEDLINEEMKKLKQMRKTNAMKRRQVQEALNNETIEKQIEQLKWAEMKQKEEKEQTKLFDAFANFRLEQNEKLDDVKRNERKRYLHENKNGLMEQQSYAKELADREKKSLGEWINKQKEQKLEDDQKTKALIESLGKSSSIHPFLNIINKRC